MTIVQEIWYDCLHKDLESAVQVKIILGQWP